ncbi:helix-turn-helix transcriptional regulator [Microbacterium sp. P07]|uniref:helix-turn-helix transcriptional regulator n=1 Tax=Microbacterium sp. P07 TaxID=3366952 RepID=UPI0037470CDE
MTTIDGAVLERVLSAVDLRLGAARRLELAPRARATLAPDVFTLVYVAAGSAHGQPPLSEACVYDSASRTVDLTPVATPRGLVEGDAFLTLGRAPVTLESQPGASLMIAELHLSDAAVMLTDVLPDFVTVTDFAALEPAAAALARVMGQNDPDTHTLRSGDPVICRMMLTTVLLSVIRAWAENGCAPAGWPSRSSDPFLDRVVAAIHTQPGRDWTVETLAGVGAMSRSVFAERFRAATGRSPASYVTEVRMDEAKRMLDSGLSVSATSRNLGYASDEGFSRAFRRATGVAPSAWRAAHRTLTPA